MAGLTVGIATLVAGALPRSARRGTAGADRGRWGLHRPDAAVAQGLRRLDVRHQRQAGPARRDALVPGAVRPSASSPPALSAGLVVFAVVGSSVRPRCSLARGAPADILPTILGTPGLWFLSRARAGERLMSAAAAATGAALLIWSAVGAVERRRPLRGGSAARAGVTARPKARPSRARQAGDPGSRLLEVPGLTPYIVPNADFYRIDTAIVVPRIDAREWS